MPWVIDGLDARESAVIQDLLYIAVTSRPVVSSIVDLDWMHDGIEDLEAEAIRWMNNFRDEEVASSVVALAWVQDGIKELEVKAIEELSYINNYDSAVAASVIALGWVKDAIEQRDVDSIQQLRFITMDDVEVAAVIVGLDWVKNGIEELELRALKQLRYINLDDSKVALTVVNLGWVRDGIKDSEAGAINWINNFRDAEVAMSVVALGWVQDGIEEIEVKTIEELSYINYDNAELAAAVVDLAWVQDGIEKLEFEAISWLRTFSDVDVAVSVVDLDWVQEGIGKQEARALEELSYLSRKNEGQAARIVDMPFLETLEPPDISTIESLVDMAWFRQADYQRVLSHPTLIGGITDDWAKIVATLYGVSDTNPDLIDTLLDPDRVTLEERVIELPLTGETHLAIIRTGPGAERSMDLLEHAVRHSEEFMAVSFPTGYVGWLFGDAVTPSFAGNNFGTHIATLSKYDADDTDESEYTASHIAHEVAHYYWSGNANWVDEGASVFMASTSENARTGGSIEVTNDPCGYVRTIAELENLGVTSEDGADSAFTCNYALGERLFVDLYRSLDEDSFREGLRDLYLLSQVEDEDEMQDDTEVGIEHVKTAFKESEDTEFPAVDVIAARWYDGTQPYAPSAHDTGLTNPILSTINGRIHTAYLSATQEGTPLSSISAEAVDDYLWLLLRWDYTVGSDTEVPLELVHYYEDGFEFGRRTVSFTADARHNNSLWSWWLQVGQSPSNLWAPVVEIGEYRLHVYNEGRKLVELEYEVTP